MLYELDQGYKLKFTPIIIWGKISGGKAKCWWYDPSCVKTVNIGTFEAREYNNFTPSSEGDWVLVIDNASANLPEPGKMK